MSEYACAILVDQNRILLGKRAVHRRAYPGSWDVIGGKIEEGETIEAALTRELTEELGITPTIHQSLGIMEDRDRNGRGPAAYHLFAVTSWDGGPPALMNDEHSRIEWFDIDTACALPDLAMTAYRSLFRQIRRGEWNLPTQA